MKRVLLAGLLGGLTLFAWESVAHLVLPLGQAGIKTLDHEQAVVSSLKDNEKEGGLYFFPAAAANGQVPPGPSGILAFQPNASMSMMPSQLLTLLPGSAGAFCSSRPSGSCRRCARISRTGTGTDSHGSIRPRSSW